MYTFYTFFGGSGASGWIQVGVKLMPCWGHVDAKLSKPAARCSKLEVQGSIVFDGHLPGGFSRVQQTDKWGPADPRSFIRGFCFPWSATLVAPGRAGRPEVLRGVDFVSGAWILFSGAWIFSSQLGWSSRPH